MANFSTADLCDADPDRIGVCEVQGRQFGGRRSFQGGIATVAVDADAGLVRDRLREPGNGRVLVVDGGGSLHHALLGDRLAAAAIDRGWAGVVLFGAVRDCEKLAGMDIGIFALGTSPRRGLLAGAGVKDAIVRFGGVEFEPGGHLWCDEDGLIVRTGSREACLRMPPVWQP